MIPMCSKLSMIPMDFVSIGFRLSCMHNLVIQIS